MPFSLSEQEIEECTRWWLETTRDDDKPNMVSFFDTDGHDGAIMQPTLSPRQINQKTTKYSNLAEDDDV